MKGGTFGRADDTQQVVREYLRQVSLPILNYLIT